MRYHAMLPLAHGTHSFTLVCHIDHNMCSVHAEYGMRGVYAVDGRPAIVEDQAMESTPAMRVTCNEGKSKVQDVEATSNKRGEHHQMQDDARGPQPALTLIPTLILTLY